MAWFCLHPEHTPHLLMSQSPPVCPLFVISSVNRGSSVCSREPQLGWKVLTQSLSGTRPHPKPTHIPDLILAPKSQGCRGILLLMGQTQAGQGLLSHSTVGLADVFLSVHIQDEISFSCALTLWFGLWSSDFSCCWDKAPNNLSNSRKRNFALAHSAVRHGGEGVEAGA